MDVGGGATGAKWTDAQPRSDGSFDRLESAGRTFSTHLQRVKA